MIRHVRKIFSYAAAAAMALLIGVGSYTSDVSAKDADGNIVIVIDPGHGGTDPGKQGINGVLESDANYAIAEAMMDELKNVTGSKYYEMPENHLMNYLENLGTIIEPINFVSRKHIATAQKKEVKHNNTALIAGSLIISAVLVGYPLYNYMQMKEQRDKLAADIDRISSVEQIVNDYYNAKDKVTDLLGFVSSSYSDNDSVLYMYNKLE